MYIEQVLDAIPYTYASLSRQPPYGNTPVAENDALKLSLVRRIALVLVVRFCWHIAPIHYKPFHSLPFQIRLTIPSTRTRFQRAGYVRR